MSALIKKILLILLLSSATLPAIAKNTILVIGDSLSAAYGMSKEQGWVSLLQQRLEENHYPYDVINASVSGDTTSNGLAQLPDALEKYHPAITIIALGGNDGLRGLPLTVIEKNLGKMTALAKGAGSKILLLGVRLPPNYGPAYITAFQQVYVNVADEYGVSVVPVMLKNMDEKRDLFQSDGIHPKPEAQPIILDNIWPALKPLL